jgi:putative endonuclease
VSRRPVAADGRRHAWRFGRSAEAACCWLLRLRGFRILARDVRTPVGEIDIVARRGRLVAFVEVKGRGSDDREVIGPRQRRRIVRAASLFIAARPQLADLDLRFDLMVVGRWRWPRHVIDAWRPEP